MKYSKVKECIDGADRETFETVLENYGEDVINAAMNCGIKIDQIEESYNGEHDSDVEFTKDLTDGIYGDFNLPPYVEIDWQASSIALMMDYCCYNNHYFRMF